MCATVGADTGGRHLLSVPVYTPITSLVSRSEGAVPPDVLAAREARLYAFLGMGTRSLSGTGAKCVCFTNRSGARRQPPNFSLFSTQNYSWRRSIGLGKKMAPQTKEIFRSTMREQQAFAEYSGHRTLAGQLHIRLDWHSAANSLLREQPSLWRPNVGSICMLVSFSHSDLASPTLRHARC